MAGKKRQVSTAADQPDVDDGIGRLARELIRAMDHYRQLYAERTGTGVTELLALGHLYHEGELSPTQLADRLDLTTGSVTALVNRLVRAGFVRRNPHADDRRRLVITLTRSGTRITAGLFNGLRDATSQALDGATPRQRSTVADFLSATTSNLAVITDGGA